MAEKIYKVRDPQGNIRQIKGPEGASDDEVIAQAQKLFSQPSGEGMPSERQPEVSAAVAPLQGLSKGIGDVMFGGQKLLGRGLSAIGATDTGKALIEDAARRQAQEEATLAPYKQQHPFLAGAGEIGGQIIGTAPMGMGMANALGAIPGVAKAAPNVLTAIRSGGVDAGTAKGLSGLATRMAGSGLTGYTSAGIINPEEAKTGGIIGLALPMVGPLIKGGVQAGKNALGLSTGVGTRPLEEAYKAGKAGGETADTFLKNMRPGGNSQMDDVLTAAKDNLATMNAAKQAEYRSGMVDIKNDKAILDLGGVENAIKDAMDMVSFKGQVKNTKAAEAVQKINDEVQAWKNLNPAEYHTPEGLDALKQKIGSMIEDIPFEQKSTRKAAGDIYSALKKEISTQAPTYDKVMKDYSQASDTIKEIERTLSLNPKASADTAMRKLQSLMRNNVSTNYGQRLKLAQELEQAGGNELMPALAGQALNEWTPRGIQRAAAMPGGLAAFSLGGLPAAAATAAFSSPRLMGETAYKAGQISNALSSQQINALNQLLYRSAPIVGTK